MAEKRANTMMAAPDEMDWRAQEDMRTLARAHEIMSDPKRHKAARNHAKKELSKMSMVASGGKKAR